MPAKRQLVVGALPRPIATTIFGLFYAHPQKKYLSISDFKDTIELMTTEEGGEVLDFSGWDIRKVLQHIKRSNATMFEWLPG